MADLCDRADEHKTRMAESAEEHKTWMAKLDGLSDQLLEEILARMVAEVWAPHKESLMFH